MVVGRARELLRMGVASVVRGVACVALRDARCREVRSRTNSVGVFPLARSFISRPPDAELHCVGLMPDVWT